MHNDFVHLVESVTGLFMQQFVGVPAHIVQQYVDEYQNDETKSEQVKSARCFLAAMKAAADIR